MELYTLDSNFRNTDLVEGYSSLIWADRYNEIGDFELKMPANSPAVSKLSLGTWIGLSETNRVQRVDTVEFSINDDGVETCTVTGRDALHILKYRYTWRDLLKLGPSPEWNVSGRPSVTTNYAVDQAIINALGNWPPMSYGHIISNLEFGTNAQFGTGDIPFKAESIVYSVDSPRSTWDYIHPLLTQYKMGARIYRHGNDGKLYYRTYSGFDRTSSQTSNAPVIFSQDLDNIENMSFLDSMKEQQYSIRVYSENYATSVTRADVSVATAWDDKVSAIVVQEPSGLTAAEYVAYLKQQGSEYLTQHDREVILDGEITENSEYVYNVDYLLGDRVEVKSKWGFANQCRVTEQIFADDENGPRIFPTLMPETLVNEDSWLAAGTQTWSTPSPDDTWSER